jgi:uncharacterized protein YjiS (DUF1127 family)
MNMLFIPQRMGASAIRGQRSGLSVVRRLVRAQDDPAKRRVRAWLGNIDDRQLRGSGLTSEDIAERRGVPAIGGRPLRPRPLATDAAWPDGIQVREAGFRPPWPGAAAPEGFTVGAAALPAVEPRRRGSWTGVLVRAARHVLARIGAGRRVRRRTAELMALDDRLLADIGLTRGQIVHASRFGRLPKLLE